MRNVVARRRPTALLPRHDFFIPSFSLFLLVAPLLAFLGRRGRQENKEEEEEEEEEAEGRGEGGRRRGGGGGVLHLISCLHSTSLPFNPRHF